MLKEKIFKFLFPKKVKEIKLLEEEIHELNFEFFDLKEEQKKFLFDFDFSEVDEDGKPPHYLKELSDVERKNYVAELESIYSNEKFIKVLNYCINLLGNKGMQVLPEDHMKDARYAILGIKTLIKEFENAHIEFINNSKKKDEEFDNLAPLPDN